MGGGFSGTALAANLLRQPPAGATRIVLIERTPVVGRGVAYAERSFPYLLNVPAGRMSASSARPLEFFEFVRRRLPNVTAEDFLPRALYGEYLQEVLLSAKLLGPRNVQLDIWHGNVCNVRRVQRHLALQVELEDGRRLAADDVVLAAGNPAPAQFPAASAVRDHPAYIADAWAQELDFHGVRTALTIGTGLTMADVFNIAGSAPGPVPTLHALSRHGLLAPQQTAFRPDAFVGDGNAFVLAWANSLRGLTRSVRALAEEAEGSGGDWREAVTFVRNMTPTVWQRLPEHNRRRFLRHLRAYWDIHRHRLPPEIVRRMDTARSIGKLHIHAGRIVSMTPRNAQIDVQWRPRGESEVRSLVVDRVVNCTGPDYAIARSKEPLWRNLVQSGLCVPDSLGLGIRTGPQGAVIDSEGWPGPHLFCVGPMLRADHWEATAVGELRGHAERLAARLASQG